MAITPSASRQERPPRRAYCLAPAVLRTPSVVTGLARHGGKRALPRHAIRLPSRYAWRRKWPRTTGRPRMRHGLAAYHDASCYKLRDLAGRLTHDSSAVWEALGMSGECRVEYGLTLRDALLNATVSHRSCQSRPARLLSNLQRGRCLTIIGTEGRPRKTPVRHRLRLRLGLPSRAEARPIIHSIVRTHAVDSGT